jgi:hypothetical protein
MNFAAALKELASDDSLDLSNRDRAKLKRIAGNKRRCRRCEERCELEARRSKKTLRGSDGGYGEGDGYGFDWNSLLEFLKGLLPIILSFIDALK